MQKIQAKRQLNTHSAQKTLKIPKIPLATAKRLPSAETLLQHKIKMPIECKNATGNENQSLSLRTMRRPCATPAWDYAESA